MEFVKQWTGLSRDARKSCPGVTGIFGQPRGGTNFIAAALHYHPRVYCVSEHELDYRRPLSAYWKTCSIYREDGRQSKQPEHIERVVFNKVQRRPELWDSQVEFPTDARFLFYIRNPIRVHLSRETYRKHHDPARVEWADTPENFHAVLSETRSLLDTYETLRSRHPCLLISHEYFCCAHERALSQLHQFLGLELQPHGNPREFFRECVKCGRELATIEHDGQTWLACPKHKEPVDGCGNFNPLRPIDSAEVRSSSWKVAPEVQRMMREIRERLGNSLADYYWNGRYTEYLTIGSTGGFGATGGLSASAKLPLASSLSVDLRSARDVWNRSD